MILSLFIFLSILFTASSAEATIYLDLDNEGYTLDTVAPSPPYVPGDTFFDLVVRSGSQGCNGKTPSGTKFLKGEVPDGRGGIDESGYHEIRNSDPTVTSLEGKTIYLAWFSCFERLEEGGSLLDIWHDVNTHPEEEDSSDKALELHGDGVRIGLMRGQISCQGTNADHRWTVWGGNPSYHLSEHMEQPGCDSFPPNLNGYAAGGPKPQFEYERWYAFVLEVKFADHDPKDGHIKAYASGRIDGVSRNNHALISVTGIQTMCGTSNPDQDPEFAGSCGSTNASNATVGYVEFDGTLCQPDYDCPPHNRHYDKIFVTDNAADLTPFLTDPEVGGGGGSSGPTRRSFLRRR